MLYLLSKLLNEINGQIMPFARRENKSSSRLGLRKSEYNFEPIQCLAQYLADSNFIIKKS